MNAKNRGKIREKVPCRTILTTLRPGIVRFIEMISDTLAFAVPEALRCPEAAGKPDELQTTHPTTSDDCHSELQTGRTLSVGRAGVLPSHDARPLPREAKCVDTGPRHS